MKRTPFLIAALVPFVAAAGASGQKAQVDQEKLRSAVPASKIIGQDVKTSDGREFGEVESIVFKQDGSVAYYGIEPDMDMYTESASTEADDAASGDMAASSEAGAGRDAMAGSGEANDVPDAGSMTVASGDDIIHVKPENISLEKNGEAVSIDMDGQSLMKQRGASSGTASDSELDAAEVIGMQVDLADAESFGEVEDIMISQEGDKAVALVVDNWDGMDKERRALPVKLESADREQDVIRYEMSKDELDKAGDFDLDQYTDRT